MSEACEAAGDQGRNSDALTDRDRGIAVIAALVAADVVDQRLDTHLRPAPHHELGKAALTQLTILLTTRAGQPHTCAAMQAVRRTTPQPAVDPP